MQDLLQINKDSEIVDVYQRRSVHHRTAPESPSLDNFLVDWISLKSEWNLQLANVFADAIVAINVKFQRQDAIEAFMGRMKTLRKLVSSFTRSPVKHQDHNETRKRSNRIRNRRAKVGTWSSL